MRPLDRIRQTATGRTGIYQHDSIEGNLVLVIWTGNHRATLTRRDGIERIVNGKNKSKVEATLDDLTAAQRQLAKSLNLTPTQVLEALSEGCE